MTRPGPSIRVWRVTYRRGRVARPWCVRWAVDGRERGPRTFATEEEAEDWRARPKVRSLPAPRAATIPARSRR